MWSFYSRHRRTFTVAAAAVAGAAAAYYLYNWWYGDLESPEVHADDKHGEDATQARTCRKDRQGPVDEKGIEAEKHMGRHFDSIQGIAELSTLPVVLPQLQTSIFSRSDVEEVTSALRDAKTGAKPVSSAEKVALWEQLKRRSFVRVITCTWGLPILDILLRVQLTILGRHLYLESVLEQENGDANARSPHLGLHRPVGGKDAGKPCALSKAGQDAILGLRKYFLEQSMDRFVQLVGKAVETQLEGVGLTDSLSLEGLQQVMSDVHSAVDRSCTPQGFWRQLLLPPTADLQALWLQQGCEKGEQPAARGGGEGWDASYAQLPAEELGVVRQLVEELELVVSSARFGGVLHQAVQETAGWVAQRLQVSWGKAAASAVSAAAAEVALPVPRVLPLMAQLSVQVLDSEGPGASVPGSVVGLELLAADIFSCRGVGA